MNARFNDPSRAQRELLSGSQIFAGLPPAVLDELIAGSRVVELSANKSLYEAGEPIREAHLLFTGSVKRSASVPGAPPKVIELVQSEQLLSLGELFSASHYAASCSCISRTLLVAIDIRKLREATANSHELSSRIISALAHRQFTTEFDVASHNYGQTGAQRLLDYLLEMGGKPGVVAGETTVILKASKKVIAARLSMSPESFSRNLRELSESGVIFVDGRKVHIQNAAVLDTVSGDSQQRVHFNRKRKGDALNTAALSAGALVNMCGRLRLLSQRMAVTWCMMVFSIAPQKAPVKLRQLEKEFERHLARLDKLEQIAALSDKLSLIKTLWPTYQQLLSDTDTAMQRVEEVFALSEQLLEACDNLTCQAALLAGLPDAHYVNIAGRNRMLSQRISKLFLFREWRCLDERILELLAPSCEEFERNLDALENPGITPPGVSAQLKVVTSQWQKFIRAMCPDLSRTAKTQHARMVLTEGERLLRSVDTTVKLFERLSA